MSRIISLTVLVCFLVIGTFALTKKENIWTLNYEHNIENPAPSQWYVQRVDHFDRSYEAEFKQQYFVNDTVFGGAGYPIFLFLGGEGPLSASSVGGHFSLNYFAEKFKALMVSIEHRFYGKSIPLGDLAFDKLRLLSSQQALADAAAFIPFIKQKYNAKTSRVLTIGGSYSGSLSAWMRLKYPQLVDAAWSTSAPVLAELEFDRYYVVVKNVLGEPCSNKLRSGTVQIQQLLNSDEGRKRVESLFSTCHPIKTEMDVATFMLSISDTISGIVQYNLDNVNYQPFSVSKMCDMLLAGDIMDTLPKVMDAINTFQGSNCTEASYDATIQQLVDVNPTNPNAASRSWTYQTCFEYGYFQTGVDNGIPFSKSITLDYYLKMCEALFPQKLKNYVKNNVAWTNIYYGARSVASTSSKIAFMNGSHDPWHVLGVLKTASTDDTAAYFINGTAHCADLYPPRSSDLPDLTRAREFLMTKLTEWLK